MKPEKFSEMVDQVIKIHISEVKKSKNLTERYALIIIWLSNAMTASTINDFEHAIEAMGEARMWFRETEDKLYELRALAERDGTKPKRSIEDSPYFRGPENEKK